MIMRLMVVGGGLVSALSSFRRSERLVFRLRGGNLGGNTPHQMRRRLGFLRVFVVRRNGLTVR